MNNTFRTLGVKLDRSYIQYFEESHILIIPHLGNYILPKNIIFNNTKILIPYKWHKNAVFNNINRRLFPSLKEVHFLSNGSSGPLDKDINKLKWIFENEPDYHMKNIIKYKNTFIDPLLHTRYLNMYSQLKINNTPINSVCMHNQFMEYCFQKSLHIKEDIPTLRILGADNDVA
jgi:hypothetical protein